MPSRRYSPRPTPARVAGSGSRKARSSSAPRRRESACFNPRACVPRMRRSNSRRWHRMRWWSQRMDSCFRRRSSPSRGSAASTSTPRSSPAGAARPPCTTRSSPAIRAPVCRSCRWTRVWTPGRSSRREPARSPRTTPPARWPAALRSWAPRRSSTPWMPSRPAPSRHGRRTTRPPPAPRSCPRRRPRSTGRCPRSRSNAWCARSTRGPSRTPAWPEPARRR